MDLSNIIDPYYFLAALCVGLLYAYLTTPAPEIIFKYPTVENASSTTYVDDAGVCYRYRVTPTTCPSPGSKETLKTVTIQQK